jgi:hypothetical protein
MKRIAIGFASLVLIVLAILSFLFWISFRNQISFASGLSSYEGLPSTASDITVFQNKNVNGIFVADFQIVESNFVAFAAEKTWSLQPITNAEFVFQAKAFHDGKPNEKLEITDGLFYSKRAENGGGITVAYDRKSGRGFIENNNR